MAKLAQTVALTGLSNRLLLRELFQDRAANAVRTKSLVALHYLDLDGFKAINDRYGHPAGDALLEQVARRLEDMVRADDVVARLGGDEFIVLRSEERRVGKECVSTCRSRWAPYHYKKKK